MKPDETIIEAVGGLHNPSAYLGGVLVHMRSCALAHGNAFLRLGVTGTGQYPCYRVIYQKSGMENIFGSFVDSHKSIPEPYNKVVPGDWSTSATEINEVIALATSLDGPAL